MNTQIFKVTLRSLLPAQGLYYFWLFFLGIIYLTASVNYGPDIHILMYFILMYFFAYISGSLLMDILAKPVTLCLPAMTTTLPWVILAAAAVFSLLCALPILLIDTAAVFEGTGLSFPRLFLLGLSLFQLVILLCFKLNSNFLLFVLFMCLFVLGPNPYLAGSFQGALQSGVVHFSFPYIAFVVISLMVFKLTRESNFRRHLSGKTVFTFADMANPQKAMQIINKMKLEALKHDTTYAETGRDSRANWKSKIGNRDLAIWLEETSLFIHRTNWTYALLNIVFFSLVICIGMGRLFMEGSAATILLLVLFITFEQFWTYYKRGFSPMLPVGRQRQFRVNLYKGMSTYLFTLVLYALLLGVFRLLFVVLPQPANLLVEPFATMPFKAVFYFGLIASVFSWILVFMRSFVSYLVLTMILAISSMIMTFTLFDNFLMLHPGLILFLSVLLFAPFVLQSHINCFKSDLIRS